MKILPALLLAAAAPLAAHVGSPDVFFDGQAGPYQLLVTIRPPQVVPGVAEIEIRSLAPDVTQIHIVPLRMMVSTPAVSTLSSATCWCTTWSNTLMICPPVSMAYGT